MIWSELLEPDYVERLYYQYMHGSGIPISSVGKKFTPVVDPHEHFWDHAFRYAIKNDGEYWEGLCELEGQTYAHAWVERNAQIVELRAGFEKAVDYKGRRVNKEWAIVITKRWKMLKRSLFDCAVMGSGENGGLDLLKNYLYCVVQKEDRKIDRL